MPGSIGSTTRINLAQQHLDVLHLRASKLHHDLASVAGQVHRPNQRTVGIRRQMRPQLVDELCCSTRGERQLRRGGQRDFAGQRGVLRGSGSPVISNLHSPTHAIGDFWSYLPFMNKHPEFVRYSRVPVLHTLPITRRQGTQ